MAVGHRRPSRDLSGSADQRVEIQVNAIEIQTRRGILESQRVDVQRIGLAVDRIEGAGQRGQGAGEDVGQGQATPVHAVAWDVGSLQHGVEEASDILAAADCSAHALQLGRDRGRTQRVLGEA